MAEHHALHGGQVQPEPVGVGEHAVRGDAGVEQQRRRGVAAPDGDQRAEAVLGEEADPRPAVLELRRRRHPHAERDPPGVLVARQEPVEDVVHQRGHSQLVDRLQRDGVDGRAGCRARHRHTRHPAGSVTHARMLSGRGFEHEVERRLRGPAEPQSNVMTRSTERWRPAVDRPAMQHQNTGTATSRPARTAPAVVSVDRLTRKCW
ncbi:MAG TPA: hypothetical protein VHS35_21100, partial [Pseudonocardia sp.]|nr:hypothetical protein [Pseudonocardia sp.]